MQTEPRGDSKAHDYTRELQTPRVSGLKLGSSEGAMTAQTADPDAGKDGSDDARKEVSNLVSTDIAPQDKNKEPGKTMQILDAAALRNIKPKKRKAAAITPNATGHRPKHRFTDEERQQFNLAETLETGLKLFKAGMIPYQKVTEVRLAVQKAPFIRWNSDFRQQVTPHLQEMTAPTTLRVPADIAADIRYLLSRWRNKDFDTDLLRGITKTTRPGDQKLGPIYKLSPEYPFKRSAAIRGDNGLEIGQWWPLQICTVRDGAHGALQAGIYYDRDGAISVILASGGYTNTDNLHEIWYSGTAEKGSGGLSDSTEAMVKAIDLKRPIRVLRKANPNNQYAPAEGLRYDGLYLVTEKALVGTKSGMMRFKLVRCPGQAEVRWKGTGDSSRPTQVEVDRWHAQRFL
jgi:hypothetical protein